MGKRRKQQQRIWPIAVILGLAIGAGTASFANFFRITSRAAAPPDLYGVASHTTLQDNRPIALDQDQSSVRLIAVGDIMLSRGVAGKLRLHGVDYPYEKVLSVLQPGDIVFGNLETPITSGRTIADDELVFRSDPGVEMGLSRAGFNILSVANNHVMNFGATGLADTLRYLKAVKIRHIGAGENLAAALTPSIIEVSGTKFAFLAFNDTDVVPDSTGATATRSGTALMDIDQMKPAVASATKNSDVVVVSMHSGVEYAAEPNASQQAFARAAIDAGADMVLGHHPHVIQPVETYKGKTIIYSLGNFVFDQMWSAETRRGVIAIVTFQGSTVASIEYRAVRIDDYSQPQLLEGPAADAVLEYLKP